MPYRVTRTWQVTIPRDVRTRLGIKPGTEIEFDVDDKGRVFLRKSGNDARKGKQLERMKATATAGLSTDQVMKLTRGDLKPARYGRKHPP